MQFTIFFTVFALFFTYARAAQMTVAYDQTYDNAGQSLSTVACSDGPNGLLTKGFTTFGSLPSYPNIGAAVAVAGWNSPNCGTCWALTYNGVTINVLAMDHAGEGFNINLDAMNKLTGGQAQFLGRVNADVEQVDSTLCGI